MVPYCDCYCARVEDMDPSLAVLGYCFMSVVMALSGWTMCHLLLLCVLVNSLFVIVSSW